MNYWIMPNIKGVSLINQALNLPQKYFKHRGRQKGMTGDKTLKRMCAVKLLRVNKNSYPQIAKKLHMKNHTTAMRAVKRINDLISIGDEEAIRVMGEVKEILKQKHFI